MIDVRRTWSRALPLLLACAALSACDVPTSGHGKSEPSSPEIDDGSSATGDDAHAAAPNTASEPGKGPSLQAPNDLGQQAGDVLAHHDDDGATPGDDDGTPPNMPGQTLPTPDLTPVTSSDVERPIELTDAALLPESLPDFMASEVASDSVTFTFSAQGADAIQAGRVLAGRGYLRRVLSVEKAADGRVIAHTAEASILELIKEGHFTLHAEASPLKTQKFAIGLPKSLPCTIEANGEVLQVTPSYDFKPELDLEVDISYDGALHTPVLHYAKAVIGGDLTLSAQLTTKGSIHGKCSVDLLAALDPLDWTTNMALGLLPVSIHQHIGPSMVVAADLLLEGGITTTASVSVALSKGVEYLPCSGWQELPWQSDVTGDLQVTPTAKGTLRASITPSLGYDVDVLGLATASAGIRADLVGLAEGDAVACTWDASLNASVTAYAHAHLKLPVVNISLVDFDEEKVLWSDELASAEGKLPAAICI